MSYSIYEDTPDISKSMLNEMFANYLLPTPNPTLKSIVLDGEHCHTTQALLQSGHHSSNITIVERDYETHSLQKQRFTDVHCVHASFENHLTSCSDVVKADRYYLDFMGIWNSSLMKTFLETIERNVVLVMLTTCLRTKEKLDNGIRAENFIEDQFKDIIKDSPFQISPRSYMSTKYTSHATPMFVQRVELVRRPRYSKSIRITKQDLTSEIQFLEELSQSSEFGINQRITERLGHTCQRNQDHYKLSSRYYKFLCHTAPFRSEREFRTFRLLYCRSRGIRSMPMQPDPDFENAWMVFKSTGGINYKEMKEFLGLV